jgi:glycosyltransferase domain-containing protein
MNFIQKKNNIKSTQLTLLLVLKGRHDFTRRWLEYANLYLNKYKIIIADGSPNNEKYNLNQKIYTNLEILLLKYPEDKNIGLFAKKIYKSINKVETKYVLYCENDDFYIQDEIENLIHILQKSKNKYISSRGVICDFVLDSYSEVYGKIISSNIFHKKINLSENNYIKRFENYNKNKHGLCHNIVKTEVLKGIFYDIIKYKLFTLSLLQFFWNYSLVLKGKIFCSNRIFMLHQNHKFMLSNSKKYGSFEESGFYNYKLFNNFFVAISRIFNSNLKNKKFVQVDKLKYFILKHFVFSNLLPLLFLNNKANFKSSIIIFFKKSIILSKILSIFFLFKKTKHQRFKKTFKFFEYYLLNAPNSS